MYEFLSGRLVSRRPDRAVVEAGGIGYRLLIPLSTFERLPPKEGAAVKLFLHHHLREDREALYGFGTEEEREFFELLTGVTGVGPALGLSILSTMPFEAFRSAVLAGDAAAVTRVKGVGKKVAARLLLELAEPLKKMGPPASSPAAPATGAAADAALALAALGYDRREAENRAVEAARDLGPGADAGEVVREILRRAR
jgi:holliday junction DNA helicase RuvA